jgi:hypothetical protein
VGGSDFEKLVRSCTFLLLQVMFPVQLQKARGWLTLVGAEFGHRFDVDASELGRELLDEMIGNAQYQRPRDQRDAWIKRAINEVYGRCLDSKSLFTEGLRAVIANTIDSRLRGYSIALNFGQA